MNIKSEKIRTNNIINGETISYTLMTTISILVLISLKQLFKIFIGVPANIAVLTAFIAAQITSYLLEKRFVFRKNILSSNIKQILMLLFRGCVDFGLYKLTDTIFCDVLHAKNHFAWLIAITIAFCFNYYFDRTILFDCYYKASSVRYSRIYKAFYHNRYIVFAAAFAAVCISIMFIIYTIFPFGDNTVMRMDLYHQYGPLFAELYDRVVNHRSFLYSWNSGGGSSFLGNYFNYLSSPLSAVIFLFDKEDVSYAITFLVSLKCIFSAATFTLYVKKSLNRHSYMTAVFGVFYAFSSYFLAYYWNVMWLDGMILLPVIALGIEKIIKEGKGFIYVFSMVLLFFSSYYMGFMACIFAVLYFFTYYTINSDYTKKLDDNLEFDKKYSLKAISNNAFINRGFKFAVYSIIAGGICAFTLIPIFFILKSCSATSDHFPTTFNSYFNIFDFITSHLAGLETTIRSSGADVLPNVYSGMLAVILLPLFVANKDIRFKEKMSYILLLILLLFSFNNNCMNFIWHAFHFPNDLPFRFSYMYSFILLVIGFKAFDKIKSFDVKDYCFVGFAWIFFIIVAQKMSTTKMLESTIYTSLAFVILWTGYLYLVKRNKLDKAVLSAIAVVICFSELLIADTQGILITQDNASYKQNYETYTEAIDYIRQNDDDFYREELSYLETRMDPCYYSYNGMSTFSSMAYEEYSRTQYSLGMFGNRINSYTYNTQTPVYNMMFNIKYLIYNDISLPLSNNIYEYKYTTEDGKASVYRNKYNLPISYCVSTDLENWIVNEGDPFEVQGDYFRLATGLSDVFKPVDFINSEFDGVYGESVTQNGTYWFNKETDDSTYGYADIYVTPQKNGNIYLYVTSPDINSIEITNNDMISHTQQIGEPYILDCGYYEVGDRLKISLDCGSAEVNECYADIFVYSLDEDVFNSGHKLLQSGELKITDYSDTTINGTINVKENSYLYSSIPYDKGWKVYVDGNLTETFEIGNAMLVTTLKPGEHTIEYRYAPDGLKYGILVTGATGIALAGFTIFTTLYKRKNAKALSC